MMLDERQRTLRVRVRAVLDDTYEIRRFLLESREGAELPAVTPGSHIDVHLMPGLVRQYSVCNGPAEKDGYIIAVKREPQSRGGSSHMHSIVSGDTLEIGLPRNNFPLAKDALGHLLLAGGIGITPLFSMARHLAACGGRFALHYFARSSQHIAFRDMLGAKELTSFVTIHTGLDRTAISDRFAKLLAVPAQKTHLYVCGPGPFMEAAVATARARGWAASCIHREYFGAAPVDRTNQENSFEVRLVASGRTIRVAPGETISHALQREGIRVDVSCEQGVCGTCLTRVLEGTPDHRDSFLTDEERGVGDRMCICVSRSIDGRPLVLGL